MSKKKDQNKKKIHVIAEIRTRNFRLTVKRVTNTSNVSLYAWMHSFEKIECVFFNVTGSM